LSQPYDTPGGQLWVYGPFYKQLISDYNAGTLCHASTLSSLLGTLYNGVYANGSTRQEKWIGEMMKVMVGIASDLSTNPAVCNSAVSLSDFICAVTSILANNNEVGTNTPAITAFRDFSQIRNAAGFSRPLEGSIAFMIYIMNGSFTDLYQDAINLLRHESG
jgi:hypothetical protein